MPKVEIEGKFEALGEWGVIGQGGGVRRRIEVWVWEKPSKLVLSS